MSLHSWYKVRVSGEIQANNLKFKLPLLRKTVYSNLKHFEKSTVFYRKIELYILVHDMCMGEYFCEYGSTWKVRGQLWVSLFRHHPVLFVTGWAGWPASGIYLSLLLSAAIGYGPCQSYPACCYCLFSFQICLSFFPFLIGNGFLHIIYSYCKFIFLNSSQILSSYPNQYLLFLSIIRKQAGI